MKFQRLISALRPDSRARLPAALALVLAVSVALQLALPSETELPPPLPVGRAQVRPTVPPTQIASASAVLGQRPLFAPRVLAATASGAVQSALGGAVVAGTVSVRGAARAVVRAADGSVRYVPIGGAIAGWRLVRLDPDKVWFRKADQSLGLPYGAATLPASSEPEDNEAEEEEEQ